MWQLTKKTARLLFIDWTIDSIACSLHLPLNPRMKKKKEQRPNEYLEDDVFVFNDIISVQTKLLAVIILVFRRGYDSSKWTCRGRTGYGSGFDELRCIIL